jgi:hypothetical protein
MKPTMPAWLKHQREVAETAARDREQRRVGVWMGWDDEPETPPAPEPCPPPAEDDERDR